MINITFFVEVYKIYYQFKAAHTGQFVWDYLERGPLVWRVSIARKVQG